MAGDEGLPDGSAFEEFGAVDGQALIQKTAFEVGHWELTGIWPVDSFKFRDLGERFFHPEEVRLVIGLDPEFAAGGEGLVQSAEERRLDQAARMVVAFGPGVRKKDGGGGNGSVREHVLDQIGVFDPQNADVGEAPAVDQFADAVHAAEQSFHGEEIAVGMAGGHFDQESPFAAAQIKFQRGGFWEQGIRVDAFKEVCGPEKDVLGLRGERFIGVFRAGFHWENLQCEP